MSNSTVLLFHFQYPQLSLTSPQDRYVPYPTCTAPQACKENTNSSEHAHTSKHAFHWKQQHCLPHRSGGFSGYYLHDPCGDLAKGRNLKIKAGWKRHDHQHLSFSEYFHWTTMPKSFSGKNLSSCSLKPLVCSPHGLSWLNTGQQRISGEGKHHSLSSFTLSKCVVWRSICSKIYGLSALLLGISTAWLSLSLETANRELTHTRYSGKQKECPSMGN